MKLTFDLQDIRYIKMDFNYGDEIKSIKLALQDKTEHFFIAVSKIDDKPDIITPQMVYVHFIVGNGIYKTGTILRDITVDGEYVYYKFENPSELDYYQNREYYRIIAEYDCIYTVNTENGTESFNGVTYDISQGGVSVLLDRNLVSTDETSIIIMLPFKDIKSHLRFVRSEIHDELFKLSFEFTDLSQADFKVLSELCVEKQLNSQ